MLLATLPTLDRIDGRPAFAVVPDVSDPAWYRWSRPRFIPSRPPTPRIFLDNDDVLSLSAIPSGNDRLLQVQPSIARKPWTIPWSAVNRLDLLPVAIDPSDAAISRDCWATAEGDPGEGLIRRLAATGEFGFTDYDKPDAAEQIASVSVIRPSPRLFQAKSIQSVHHRITLDDGSRVRVADLIIRSGVCYGQTVRGFEVAFSLDRVTSIEVENHPAARRIEVLGGRMSYTPFGDELPPQTEAGRFRRGQRQEFESEKNVRRVIFRVAVQGGAKGRVRVVADGKDLGSAMLERVDALIPAGAPWTIEYLQAGPGEFPGGEVKIVEGWTIRR